MPPTSTSPHKLTPAQLAKYKRQKCINILEKIAKSMFQKFRDPTTTKKQLLDRFATLHHKLTELGDVPLHTAYPRALLAYVHNLQKTLATDFDLDTIRDKQMTTLNRIQKIKKETNYRREKHNDKMIQKMTEE